MINQTKIIVICLLTLLLSACDPIPFRYDKKELSSRVISVELINYDNPESQVKSEFFIIGINHGDFKTKNMEVQKTMDPEYYDNFFDNLCEAGISNFTKHRNSPYGICIKMNYEDGKFDIISPEYVGHFDNDGSFIKFYGELYFYGVSFEDTLDNYFK